MKINSLDKKEAVYHYFIENERVEVISCEEEVIEGVQELTGDFYKLKYLGIDSKYSFYLALGKENILGYSIIQKYFERYHLHNDKGRFRGEPCLIYSLERKKGVGSLLFLVSSLEILKDDKVEVFRCEAVQGNIIDKLCSRLSLEFVETKDVFNVYELNFKKGDKKDLEEKIKEQIKFL